MYGYPKEDAAQIAVREVMEFLSPAKVAEGEDVPQNGRARSPVSPERSEPRKRSLEVRAPSMEVIFCCFSARDAAFYEKLLS